MDGAPYQDLTIFSGNAHPALAQAICSSLEMPLGQCEVFEFSNENIFVRVLENVRSKDVFIIQPLSSPVNRSVMELLIMIDAFKRASAGRVTAVLPYYGYGRSDKKDQPRVPITARLLANLIETAGADRVLTVDLHAGQIQGFFNIPVDELTALYILSRYFKDRDVSAVTVLATDVGGAKRARNLARQLDTPLAVVDKERIGNQERVVGAQPHRRGRGARRHHRRRRDRHGRYAPRRCAHRPGAWSEDRHRGMRASNPFGPRHRPDLRERDQGARRNRYDPARAAEAPREGDGAERRADPGRGDHPHSHGPIRRRAVPVALWAGLRLSQGPARIRPTVNSTVPAAVELR